MNQVLVENALTLDRTWRTMLQDAAQLMANHATIVENQTIFHRFIISKIRMKKIL